MFESRAQIPQRPLEHTRSLGHLSISIVGAGDPLSAHFFPRARFTAG